MDNIKTFGPGEIVILEGAQGTSAFVILSGSVGVYKRSGERDVLMATLGEGQVFGEMGLIEDRPRSATVKAMKELKVREIDRNHFNELLQKKPSAIIPILKMLFERLRQASERLVEKITAEGEASRHDSFEVVMEGQTEEAKEALAYFRQRITTFPFLIGRNFKNAEDDVFCNNDLAIREERPYVVSRNHLSLNIEGEMIWVIDRGSAFGTIVNGKEIGGKSSITRAPLDRPENQLVLGPPTSKLIFLLKVIPK